MNYYKQGDAANADKIKAAFEKRGFTKEDHRDIYENNVLFFTVDGDKNVHYCWIDQPYCNIIMTHPDYQELGLPKPNYDIANFKPFDKVLVRDGKEPWRADFFEEYDDNFYCFRGAWEQCIPFNGDTKHLLGTTEMCPQEYINW